MLLKVKELFFVILEFVFYFFPPKNQYGNKYKKCINKLEKIQNERM